MQPFDRGTYSPAMMSVRSNWAHRRRKLIRLSLKRMVTHLGRTRRTTRPCSRNSARRTCCRLVSTHLPKPKIWGTSRRSVSVENRENDAPALEVFPTLVSTSTSYYSDAGAPGAFSASGYPGIVGVTISSGRSSQPLTPASVGRHEKASKSSIGRPTPMPASAWLNSALRRRLGHPSPLTSK